MSKTREKKKDDGAAGGWLGRMLDVLRGGGIGLLTALAVLGIASVLISTGVLSDTAAGSVVIAACLAGALIGGLVAVRRAGSGVLPTGLGVGLALFLLLLSAGLLLYGAAPEAFSGGGNLCACLCGGGLAGILGRRPKKKRRK